MKDNIVENLEKGIPISQFQLRLDHLGIKDLLYY